MLNKLPIDAFFEKIKTTFAALVYYAIDGEARLYTLSDLTISYRAKIPKRTKKLLRYTTTFDLEHK